VLDENVRSIKQLFSRLSQIKRDASDSECSTDVIGRQCVTIGITKTDIEIIPIKKKA